MSKKEVIFFDSVVYWIKNVYIKFSLFENFRKRITELIFLWADRFSFRLLQTKWDESRKQPHALVAPSSLIDISQ